MPKKDGEKPAHRLWNFPCKNETVIQIHVLGQVGKGEVGIRHYPGTGGGREKVNCFNLYFFKYECGKMESEAGALLRLGKKTK